jgi:hypothetical protein
MKECTYGDVRTAQLEIESADAHIAGLVKRLTDADWLDASLYHLTVNAEGTPGEACAKLIGGLANSSQFRDTATSRDELTNMLLGARQRNWHSELGGPRGSTVTVVDGHEVPLTCDDSHENAIAKIERHLHGEWTSYGARDRRRTLR